MPLDFFSKFRLEDPANLALRIARGYISANVYPNPTDRELRLLRLLDRTLDESKVAAVMMGVSNGAGAGTATLCCRQHIE
jgi:hypothetical protein